MFRGFLWTLADFRGSVWYFTAHRDTDETLTRDPETAMPEKLTRDIIESEPAPKSGSTLLFDTEVKGFGARVFARRRGTPLVRGAS